MRRLRPPFSGASIVDVLQHQMRLLDVVLDRRNRQQARIERLPAICARSVQGSHGDTRLRQLEGMGRRGILQELKQKIGSQSH